MAGGDLGFEAARREAAAAKADPALAWCLLTLVVAYLYREQVAALAALVRTFGSQGAEFADLPSVRHTTTRVLEEVLMEVEPTGPAHEVVPRQADVMRQALDKQQPLDPQKREAALLLHLAGEQLGCTALRISTDIFLSQLGALEHVAAVDAPADIRPFYAWHVRKYTARVERFRADFPDAPVPQVVDFAAWADFRVRHRLTVLTGAEARVTPRGSAAEPEWLGRRRRGAARRAGAKPLRYKRANPASVPSGSTIGATLARLMNRGDLVLVATGTAP